MSARSDKKKKRGAETAATAAASTSTPAAAPVESEDRSVKQRCDPAVDASSSPAAAASIHSSATPLTRLPSVLVHLVMQQLSLEELARLASTCKLMRADAVHPSAGRYVESSFDDQVSLAPPPSAGEYASAPKWQQQRMRKKWQVQSPLGRAHLAVTAHANVQPERLKADPALAAMSHSERVAALIEKIAGFSRVETLNLTDAANWPEQDALALLQSPSVQRVQQVEGAAGVWLREAVQTALCRLPLLMALDVTLDKLAPSLRLHPSAFAAAASLRSLVIDGVEAPTYKFAGLMSAPPQLTSLALRSRFSYSREEPDAEAELMRWLTRHCKAMLSQLRVLKLNSINLSLLSPERMAEWMGAMSVLRYLDTNNWYPNDILRGLIAVGAGALPALRGVRFWQDRSGDTPGGGSLSQSLLRKFLRAFPRVRYCLSIVGDGDEATITDEDYAGWPRVCTAREHAEPGLDGVAGKCVQDPDADDESEGEADAEAEGDGEAEASSESESQAEAESFYSADVPWPDDESDGERGGAYDDDGDGDGDDDDDDAAASDPEAEYQTALAKAAGQ